MRNRILAGLAVALAAAGVGAALTGGGGDDPAPPGTAGSTEASVDAGDTGGTERESTGATTTTTAGPPGPGEEMLERAESPAGPAELAEVVAAAETAIRDSATPAAHLEVWADAQQRAYRTLARQPEWDDAVASELGDDLAPVAGANARANRELWALTDPREALPDWTIVSPPPPDELRRHYEAAQAEFGVAWEYLAAIHLVESRMGRIRGDSSAGAQGPMQFLPSTWEAYGEGDIHDYGDAIRAAGRYLADHGAPGDMARALFAYNHSDHYVSAVDIYANIMRDDPRAYLGYYHWDVYYRLRSGDVRLPEGWTAGEADAQASKAGDDREAGTT